MDSASEALTLHLESNLACSKGPQEFFPGRATEVGTESPAPAKNAKTLSPIQHIGPFSRRVQDFQR